VATEFDQMLSGRQPRQGVKFSHCFTDWLCLHLQGVSVAWKMKFRTAPSEGQSRATIFWDEKGYSCRLAALGNISEFSLLHRYKTTSECYLCQASPTRRISELVPPWQCKDTHKCVGTTEALTQVCWYHWGLHTNVLVPMRPHKCVGTTKAFTQVCWYHWGLHTSVLVPLRPSHKCVGTTEAFTQMCWYQWGLHTSVLVPLRPSHILDWKCCLTGPTILTWNNQIFTRLVAYRQPASPPLRR
jgi:hypothetical protein